MINYWVVWRNQILLLFAYAKNVAVNLTPKQTSQLAKLVKYEFSH